jgi:hypothetical protein
MAYILHSTHMKIRLLPWLKISKMKDSPRVIVNEIVPLDASVLLPVSY